MRRGLRIGDASRRPDHVRIRYGRGLAWSTRWQQSLPTWPKSPTAYCRPKGRDRGASVNSDGITTTARESLAIAALASDMRGTPASTAAGVAAWIWIDCGCASGGAADAKALDIAAQAITARLRRKDFDRCMVTHFRGYAGGPADKGWKPECRQRQPSQLGQTETRRRLPAAEGKMPRLTDYYATGNELLAVPVHELAEMVLRLAQDRRQAGRQMVHVQAFEQDIQGANGQPGYAMHHQEEVHSAIAEAWSWLETAGLLVRAHGMNGTNGWFVVSRAGWRVLADNNFARFRRQASFPKELLHPSIADEVWADLLRDRLDIAVIVAFRAVEVAVRDAGGYGANDLGIPLMRRAFDPRTGPLRDPDKTEAERENLAHLFVGAISYKNGVSHRTGMISEVADAQEMVMLATHLLRIVDARVAAGPTPAEPAATAARAPAPQRGA